MVDWDRLLDDVVKDLSKGDQVDFGLLIFVLTF